MRYKLTLIPDDGEPGTILPEGTYRLDILAHWSVTGEDGKFEGGTRSIRFEVEK